MDDTPIPDPVRGALEAWLAAHDEVAPRTIEGLYLVGSVALDDWTPHSDIDVVAVVAEADPFLSDERGDRMRSVSLITAGVVAGCGRGAFSRRGGRRPRRTRARCRR